MISCSGCGTGGQPDAARFCFSCGAGLQAPACASCGADMVPGARFCSSCGVVQGESAPPAPAAAGPVASRRVTSVLFGDLVGFTTLSETRDQEDVRELLSSYFDECRQIIARYGGTVEKFIGDAVMSVWGVPTAHEDDAERAVRAGLELVNRIEAMGADVGVPGLAMRIGIVTGEVAVTIGALHEGMVAGDAVNTAARVQSVATPGQVWVDETTRLLTTSAISYVDVGSHDLKGKVDPVPLWSVRAVVASLGGAQRADGLEATHTGRDRELRLVKELFHGVEETGRPALLVVDGEGGIGKTRLGWEFNKYLDGLSTNVRWHSGRCLSYGEGVAYYALAEAIRGRFLSLRPEDEEPGETEEDQRMLLRLGLEEYVADADEREWLEPRLGALLGIGAVGSFKREDLFIAWTTLLQRIGDDEVVVLVIDDAQHADDGLVMFLEYLMAVASFPVFVLLLARQGLLEARPTLATNRRATVLHLEALTAPEMGALLDGLVVGLPDGVRTSLVSRAEGIPLFAVETVRSLIDRDLVLPRGGQYVLADPDRLDLDALGAPASLQALIAARLDTLDAGQRRVIDRASVIGDAFKRDQIGALCPDVDDLDGALAGLVRLQLLRQEQDRLSAELGHYQFVQSAVRQVAYGTLSRRDRKASHLAVVSMLELDDGAAGEIAPILAQHLLEAIDAVPEAPDTTELTVTAVSHLRQAATRASGLGAPREAAGHLQVALDRCPDPALSAQIGTDLAEQLTRAGAHLRAIEEATRARAAFDDLGDVISAARASALLCRALMAGPGEYQQALTIADERLGALTGLEDAAHIELMLAREKVVAVLRLGHDLRDSTEHHARLADLVGDDSEIADSYISLALHFNVAGPRGLGRVLLDSAVERARVAHDPNLLARAMVNVNAEWTQDDAERAVEAGRQALAAARVVSDRVLASGAAANLILALQVGGGWDEALALVDDDLLDENDAIFGDLVRCRIADARATTWEARARVDSDQDRAALSVARALAARQRLRDGDEDAGQLLVESARLMYQQAGIFDDFTILWQFVTDLVWEAGDRHALQALFDLLDQDQVNRRSRGLASQLARMHGLMGIADGAPAELVECQLRRAIAEARAWHSIPTLARTQADLGTWLTRQGRADEAAEPLAEARAGFEQLGAAAWLAQLDESLVRVTA